MDKLGFDDFIGTVEPVLTDFITRLHRELLEGGCKVEVKEAKSGYVVSYLYNKKAIANYVFRKKGILVRIYANHVLEYEALLDTLPNEMAKAIEAAPVCKRLINPDDCNSKCAMGYDFILHGQRQQKCRNNAFMFLLCEENNPSIKAILKSELAARCKAKF